MKFMATLFAVFGVVCIFSALVGAENMMTKRCREAGYDYGFCRSSARKMVNGTNPERCKEPIRCVREGDLSGQYVAELVNVDTDGFICSWDEKDNTNVAAMLMCHEGSCSETVTVYPETAPSETYYCVREPH